MSKVRDGDGTPRAIVHKRILEVAKSRPDVSLAEVAGEVSGATPDLVERVLEKYGDPGDTEHTEDTMSQNGQHATADGTDDTSGEQDTDDATTTDDDRAGTASAEHDEQATDDAAEVDDGLTDPPDLTDTQLETVSVVSEYPDATQGEIADHLGVSRATVSRRLNDIPGFEWANREAFTTALFEDTDLTPAPVPEESMPDTPGATDAADSGEPTTDAGRTTDAADHDETLPADALAEVVGRLDDIEDRLEDVAEEAAETDSPEDAGDRTDSEQVLRPALAQKVVHAAMDDDRITEEEELELLASLLSW